MLITVTNQMRNRDNISLQTGKKNGAGAHVSDKKLEDIPIETRARVYNACLNELHNRFMERGTKKVYLSEEAKGIKLATSQRKITRALHSAPTGSAFSISGADEGDIVRLFLYWNNEADRIQGRAFGGTDLDLSVSFMNNDFKVVNQLGFFNPKIKKIDAVHSGDVRSTFEKPGCEFVDFSIKKAIEAGIRYVAATVNVYDGDVFSALDECFCGWMIRDGETGKLFEPKTVKNKYDLTSDSCEALMVVFDLQEDRACIGDVGIGTRRFGGNACSESEMIELLSNSIVNNNTISLVEISRLWAEDNKLAESVEDADIIISDEDIPADKLKDGAVKISPFDTNALRDALMATEEK